MTSSHTEILEIIDRMDREANELRKQCLKMSWHMRGGASYEDVMNMSYIERNIVSEIIKDNIETTNKTKLPYF